VCGVCGDAAAKYKCPRCAKRTCSLKCVKAHKQADDCSGQRNRAEYRSIPEFTDQ
ncbi:hypothetical protein T484DRAFT_1592098, partial [Baffinella frigidus]